MSKNIKFYKRGQKLVITYKSGKILDVIFREFLPSGDLYVDLPQTFPMRQGIVYKDKISEIEDKELFIKIKYPK